MLEEPEAVDCVLGIRNNGDQFGVGGWCVPCGARRRSASAAGHRSAAGKLSVKAQMAERFGAEGIAARHQQRRRVRQVDNAVRGKKRN